jgi:hypothetical protein
MAMSLTSTCTRSQLVMWVVLYLLACAIRDASAFASLSSAGTTPISKLYLSSSSWSPSNSSSQWFPTPMGSSVSAEPRVTSARAYSTPSSNIWSARNPAAGRNRKNCYYKMLGISISADAAEVKQAFRRMVKKYHPGKGSARMIGWIELHGKRDLTYGYPVLLNCPILIFSLVRCQPPRRHDRAIPNDQSSL